MEKTIFISCGQYSAAEKQLGKKIAELVRAHTDLEPFFAEDVHSLDGLDDNILGALRDCVAFIIVLHPRGEIGLVAESKLGARLWTGGAEYRVEKTIVQLARERKDSLT